MQKTSKKLTTSDFTLDSKNANKGSDRGRQLLAESLKKLGAGRSIVCDRNFNVIGGNKTLEQAQALGLEVEAIHTKGDRLIAVVRDDLDLDTDPKARELAYADNRVAELDLNWDIEKILEDIDQLNIDGLWTIDELDQLQDSLDLKAFEKIANDSDEDKEPENKISNNKPESDLVPFNCLLTQQQRQQLFNAIKLSKSKHGLETTAEALDAIAQEYLNE